MWMTCLRFCAQKLGFSFENDAFKHWWKLLFEDLMGFPASDFLGCAADSGLCIVFGAMSLWKRNVEWSFERSPMMLARAVLSLDNFTGFCEAVRLLKKLEKKWHCWSVDLTFKVLFICLLHYKWLLVSCTFELFYFWGPGMSSCHVVKFISESCCHHIQCSFWGNLGPGFPWLKLGFQKLLWKNASLWSLGLDIYFQDSQHVFLATLLTKIISSVPFHIGLSVVSNI